ncbi:MAG: hypothetical protein H7A21_10755 [Spirochaetales bacterium]|nr:hypothetical protein [Leptospiraceae bacterium]MCP5481903.1 hypothetical protein [Spirochaetales bacterium]
MRQATLLRHMLLVILVLTAGLFPVRCLESPEETIERLSLWIASGREQEALEEIDELLAETNNESSIPIDEDSVMRLLGRSIDGSRVAWISEGRFYFRGSDSEGYVNIGEEPVDFNLSYSGRFATVIRRENGNCQALFVDLNQSEIIDLPTENERLEVRCNEVPAITDDGRYIYFARDGGVRHLALNETGLAESDRVRDLPSGRFRPKYRLTANRFVLHQVGDRGLIIFFGTAGYYQGYYYAGMGTDLQAMSQPCASPELVLVFDGDTVTEEANPEQAGRPDPEVDFADAFVFVGGAGRRKLHSLRWTNSFAMGSGINARTATHLIYLRDRRQFIVLGDNRMFYWDAQTNRRSSLPLLARQFELYNGGLVYVDLLNRLYLRRAPFSRLELDLVRLREEANAARDSDEPPDS